MSVNNQGTNQSDDNRPASSGSVHARSGEAGDIPSSPETRRARLLNNDEAAAAYEHPNVLCFAARNRRGRFYVPCIDNFFGGMHVENVLFDSGCSTLLLPYPLEGFPPSFLNTAVYQWIVSSSRGTGALHSPVLKITIRLGRRFTCKIAGKQQPGLTMLRFQLGSQAANRLLNTPNLRATLDENCITKLNDFVTQLGDRSSPERTYALLGQSYFSQVMYCQIGDVAIALSEDFDGSDNIIEIMGQYHQKLEPLVNAFQGFHDLEDDDGDEDEEEYHLSYDLANSDDEIDEPDYR